MVKGAGKDLARRMAPKGRPPTAMELWGFRLSSAVDELKPEGDQRYRDLVHELLKTMDIVRRRPGALHLVKGQGWQQHPHAGDREWGERKKKRLWSEIGELLGVGPPPG